MLYFKLLYLFALFNILNISRLEAQDSINDNWQGWRGHNYGSIELKSPPVKWSIHDNIVWKSSIEGEGHSSPVTDGKFIYITSSSKNNFSQITDDIFIILEIFLVLILLYSTIRDSGFKAKQSNFNIALFILSISILSVILFILILGNGYFNYNRCDLRVWFITVFIYTLLIIFFLLHLSGNKSKANKFRLFFITIFPVFLFIIMPSKSHAFRGGLFHIASLTTILALVIPFFIPLFLFTQSYINVNIANETLKKINHLLLKKIRLFLVIGFVMFVIFILTIYLISPIEESENIRYKTFISNTGSIILALLTLLLVVIYKYVKKNRIIVLTIIVVMSDLILFCILEKLFSQISYLRYHLGNQKILFIRDDFTFHTGYFPLIIILIIIGYYFNMKYKVIQIFSIIPFAVISLFIIQNFLINKQVIHDRNVICYDIKTGKEIWRNCDVKDIKYEIHDQNTLASSTPLILNNSVITYFGNCGLICVNRTSGKTEWINKELKFNSYYGVASSPVSYNNNIYLLHGEINKQIITSINCKNGSINWQSKIMSEELIYRPPLIRKSGNNCSIICVSNKRIWIFNEKDGELKDSKGFEWIGGDPVSSMIPDNENQNLFYVSGRSYTIAIDLEKINNNDFIVWKTKTIGANCSSPVIYMDFLFILSDNGSLSCLNRRSGKIIYKNKLPGYYYSSLCRAGRYLYATNIEGETNVFEIQQNILIERTVNKLDEKVYASIAFVNNMLVFRTLSSLFLIE